MAPVAPLSLLSLPLSVIGLVCGILILIHAFQNAVWKGLLCLLTGGIFMLYYAFAEFQHEKKALILVGWLLPTVFSTAMLFGVGFMG